MTIQVKHSKVSTIPDAADTSLVRPSDWNADHTLVGTIDVANGGTGADNSTDALNNLLPTQTGQSGKYLSTDGTNPQWQTVPSAGGGSSVSYYLNGGVSQGTFGGNTYYQMNKTPVTATPANFTIAANGYIAQFITDANDPALLNIPAGNWNFELYFSASSSGGSPSFYVELYKYNGTTFTLISSGSTSPEAITGGTVKDVYLSALAVPATTLALTDRLAVRIYVTHSGRTITLYTQDNNLCQVTTTFSTGITALNGLTAQVQTFATGTTGTDFNISSATSTHTFNLPTASATNRGALSAADWTTFNNKANAFTYTNTYIPYGQGTTTPNQSANLTFDGTNLTAGAIQNTPIGATTPSTGNFTTLTAQTEVLRGTGQNLVLQSNTFNTTWSTVASTIATTVATTDPFGGSNAWILTPTSSVTTGLTQTITNANGTYTLSLYAKVGTATWLRLFATSATPNAWFNLSTGVVGTVQAGATATITSIGNGWYRCSITSVSNNSIGIRIADADGVTSGTTGQYIYIYGAQLEVSSTVGTYTATTTTAVYGTPTLSFSGVSTIGLEQTGALYLQPAGTGAIQAQATTSSATGGNARGANAVDWQTSRSNASEIASGSFSGVLSGRNNTASAFNSTIAGGGFNLAQGNNNFIGGGQSNVVNGNFLQTASAIVGGQSNTANGYYNFIGGGFTNSGTPNSAVTTQSGTMNGTTAVTLSGSNANIKVGQYISGTSIANDTYVAAISGTSLTLSKNASGSSTSTLSFFTPHGVVVGGGNNQATGSYSVICGGGDAGNSANRNVASGDWSAVVGGRGNTASGNGSFVGGGGYYNGLGAGAAGNTASGDGAFVGAGFSNSASSFGSSILGGNNNTANATYSVVLGSQNGIVRGIQGNTVSPASATPIGTPQGSAQSALLILGRQTTDATATVLCSNSSAAGTTNQVILPNNSAYLFKATVISGVTGGGNTSGWKLEGVIKRGANAASTAIVGSVTTTLLAQDAGASTWAVTATADTTNGGLKITFTGQAGTTIRTVCSVQTVEMTF